MRSPCPANVGLFFGEYMKTVKKKLTIKIPASKPKLMPVNKANQTMKSKKDYSRKEKHKKPLA